MNRIEVRVPDELYDQVVLEAADANLSLGEVLARAFAREIGKDDDAWKIEKGRPGRKPKLAKDRERVA